MSDIRRMKDFNSVRIRSSNDLTTFISGRAKILSVYVSEAAMILQPLFHESKDFNSVRIRS